MWEYFCDESYYHLYCIRLTTAKAWGECFHVRDKEDAQTICRILNDNKAYNTKE